MRVNAAGKRFGVGCRHTPRLFFAVSGAVCSQHTVPWCAAYTGEQQQYGGMLASSQCANSGRQSSV